ncbi:MAG: hypothetical protein FWB86_02750 [Treponema sp.]|nr:hypothetical protein [Treponema sp.]MCL2251689.1 hypothetical protein [Treponema sp.]
MKKVYWIDDNPSAMMQTIKNLFPLLWENNFNSQIFFVGDNYREHCENISRDKITLDSFDNTISKIFEEFCEEHVDESNSALNTPKKVRENYFKMGMKLYSSEEIEDKNTTNIANKIAERIDNDSFVGVDIRLFTPDKDQLEDKEGNYETLAMKLYYLLSIDKIKNSTVFLYTSFPTPNIQEKWEKKFMNYHPDYQNKIRIFTRQKLVKNDKETNELLELLKKKV